eukprot:Hpha_TRINITY_DN16619_c1_g2::TRINITY_DN16619_c1_g2_i2::g.178795::m.178795
MIERRGRETYSDRRARDRDERDSRYRPSSDRGRDYRREDDRRQRRSWTPSSDSTDSEDVICLGMPETEGEVEQFCADYELSEDVKNALMMADQTIAQRVMQHTRNGQAVDCKGRPTKAELEFFISHRLRQQAAASTNPKLHRQINTYVREHQLDDLADSTLRMQRDDVVDRVLRWNLPRPASQKEREARRLWASRQTMVMIKAARRRLPRPRIADPPSADVAPLPSRSAPAPAPRPAPVAAPAPARAPNPQSAPRASAGSSRTAAPKPKLVNTAASGLDMGLGLGALEQDEGQEAPAVQKKGGEERRLDQMSGLYRTYKEFTKEHGQELGDTLWAGMANDDDIL